MATAKRPSTPAAQAKEKPFLRFHHSDALRAKTLEVLAAVETAPNPVLHRDDLADLVVELTATGLDTFFMEPLKLAKAGFITEKSANLGLAGASSVIGSVIRKIIGRMDTPQLLSVCGSIRNFMR